MLRLIIQNHFHLLLKYFRIGNSWSDVLSAPLFVAAVFIFVASAVKFQVGVLAAEDFSGSNLPLQGLTMFAVLFAWEMAWNSPIVNIVLQTMKRQLIMNSKSLSVECYPETKMLRDVKLLYDVMADTIGCIQVKMRAASLQLARTPRSSRTARALRARRDYKLTSRGITNNDEHERGER